MRSLFFGLTGLLFSGCSMMIERGDYVTYTSEDYVFIQNSFIDKSIDCIELGEIQQGGMGVKYCVGENYASQFVQGFIFEHQYKSIDERLIGGTLSFQTKTLITIPCSSETIDGVHAGTEYINCMIPQKNFDLYYFIMNSKKDVNGIFQAAVGDERVYRGVIGKEGKVLLDKFYKDRRENSKIKWKRRSL